MQRTQVYCDVTYLQKLLKKVIMVVSLMSESSLIPSVQIPDHSETNYPNVCSSGKWWLITHRFLRLFASSSSPPCGPEPHLVYVLVFDSSDFVVKNEPVFDKDLSLVKNRAARF